MPEASTRNAGVWTVPNALSFLRLLGVPLFLWLVLGPEEDGWALLVLSSLLSGLLALLAPLFPVAPPAPEEIS